MPRPRDAAESQPGPQQVVLKIRRRKFQRTFQKGEIVITRRLFRTGESEYLLNGKLCRLRDIQDIFMGTGLGPESYAIIGQERIGQLLSSKPHDRRAIIEEAAGITRFKTKKRLAELRLESAKQNLARVDDIFEEVTRQMNSLKRQAAKAERFAAVRDELRARLRVVLASRMAQMDARAGAPRTGDRRAHRTDQRRCRRNRHDGSQPALADRARLRAGARRPGSPEPRQHRRPSNWSAPRPASAATSSASANSKRAWPRPPPNWSRPAPRWRPSPRSAPSSAPSSIPPPAKPRPSARRSRPISTKRAPPPRKCSAPSGKWRSTRRHAMHLLAMAGNARNSVAQSEESLAALEREAERLEAEMGQSRNELENLGVQSGQARLNFESATETLKRLEGEIVALREDLQARRSEENALRARANQLRGELASVAGRRDSLQALIRNHSYSTDTVRQTAQARRAGRRHGARGHAGRFP